MALLWNPNWSVVDIVVVFVVDGIVLCGGRNGIGIGFGDAIFARFFRFQGCDFDPPSLVALTNHVVAVGTRGRGAGMGRCAWVCRIHRGVEPV